MASVILVIMPDEPIKFRCYRCGKLLGAPLRRVGAVVVCPRCRAELEVPIPSAVAPLPSGAGGDADEEVAVEPEFPVVVHPAAVDEVAIPPIRIDPTPSRLEPTPVPRAPDVVLPPGVVMAWSLLVLMAVPLAFIAGLLVGRFVWR